jgi:hypothetical protein
MIVDLEGTPPVWFESAVGRVNEFLRLPENWDGYGARTVKLDWVVEALRLALEIIRSDTPPPSFGPTTSGGIQFEWHENEIDLEVEVESLSEFAVYYLNDRTGEERELTLRHDLRDLVRFVDELSHPHLRIARGG